MADSMRVGFIGLGNMGSPMAKNVSQAGFDLTVRDVDASLTHRIADACGAVAATAATDFDDVDVVVTMLPTSTIVSEALFGWDDGIVPHLAAEAVVVDMSSSDPTQTKDLGDRLKAHGVDLVDAPVSGGIARAITGELSIMLGGDDEFAIDKALPVVETMSREVFRTGGSGSGHAMKALNNFVAAAATTAACEALVVGQRFGLDQRTILDVLNSSTGRSWVTENVLGHHVIDREFNSGFSLALYSKDVGIARTLAAAVDDPAPVCTAVANAMEHALTTMGNVDHTEAIAFWERQRMSSKS